MIREVTTKKDLRRFVYFVKSLYADDPHYVFPLFSVLMKELRAEVLQKKTYKALLVFEDFEVKGRILYTFSTSKNHQGEVCFFSLFDAIDDVVVAKQMFDYIENDMISKGVSYIEGAYTPYDPDTRRGILVQGFDIDPTLFTSYNYEYYGKLLEACGYIKAYDTYSLSADESPTTDRVMNLAQLYFHKRHDVRIDSLNLKKLDKDLSDIHHVFEIASTELNYQNPPSLDVIRKVAKNLRFFIEPQYIKIAREPDTEEAVGFCVVLPDYNQVFKRTRGKIRPLMMLLGKKKITKTRGIMQYVVPKYQNTGLIGSMFHSVYKNFKKNGITEFEAGTIMEDNVKSISMFNKFGGKIIKTYRIYGKEIKQ